MPPANFMVALPTTSVRVDPASSFTPLTGDWRVGAVALSVEPSALALATAGVAALGEAGAADCLPHATARAMPPTRTGVNQNLRIITKFPPRTSKLVVDMEE